MNAAAVRLRRDERWAGDASPMTRFSKPMALLALASLLAHAAILGTAALTDRKAVAPPTEIAVDLVTQMPKLPAEAPKLPVEAPKPIKLGRTEPPAPKIEPKEAEAPRTEASKAEFSKPDAPQPQTRKAEPVKADVERPQPGTSPKLDDADRKLAELQKELAGLRDEQAALEAERAVAASQPVVLRDTGLGPLPDSFQAVALPTTSDAAGEAVGYRDLVFSALAKAKGFGRTKGLPGSAGVHFEIDRAGRLASVTLVHQSGVPSLDAEALDIVRRAAPFPTPPQGAQRSFDANVNFVTESAQ